MSGKIFVGDIGTEMIVQILNDGTAEDLSAVADIELAFTPPDGEAVIKKKSAGELVITDAINGKFTFTAPKDFWAVGRWIAVPKIIWDADDDEFIGTKIIFEVFTPGA